LHCLGRYADPSEQMAAITLAEKDLPDMTLYHAGPMQFRDIPFIDPSISFQLELVHQLFMRNYIPLEPEFMHSLVVGLQQFVMQVLLEPPGKCC